MKILFLQYTLQPPGGGNSVAVWMLEALKNIHAVSVLTWVPFNPREIDRFYGTTLSESEFFIIPIPALGRALFSLDPNPHEFHQKCYLRRRCKKIGHNHDLVMSADNETDFGRRGIQYVHFPWSYGLYKKLHPNMDKSQTPSSDTRLWKGMNAWRLISDNSLDSMESNLTLVNSNWTGREVKRRYGIETSTVYPPVVRIDDTIPWDHRENGFVCVGRISPEKRLEDIIEILRKIRNKGFDVHLHLIGTVGTGKAGKEYYDQIRTLIEPDIDWLKLHENLSRAELNDFIVKHRYGIHGNFEEHFGIAVAEMVQAGCIPFVPNSGGQVEIVGDDDRVSYSDSGEAMVKIIRVLGSRTMQEDIRTKLRSRGAVFSVDRFTRDVRAIVRNFE